MVAGLDAAFVFHAASLASGGHGGGQKGRILAGPELARNFSTLQRVFEQMKRILVGIKRVVDYNIRIRVKT